MEGTIKIEAIPDKGVSLKMNIRHVSILDMMGVFDALAEGFNLDKDRRRMIGLMFAMGGVNTMPGVEREVYTVDAGMLEKLKNMKEQAEEDKQVKE